MHCGSNAFQDYFDDAKELRVKKVSRIKIKIQDSRIIKIKIQESRFNIQVKNQDSRIKRRLHQDKY